MHHVNHHADQYIDVGWLLEFYFLAISKIISGQVLTSFVSVLLFYVIAAGFQFYLNGDMMSEMRRRKPKPTTGSSDL